jgi:sugar lactone lactonase YvrE
MDKAGRLIALRRGQPPVVEFDLSGKVLRTWGTGLILAPHGLYIDREGFVWITDAPYRGEAETVSGKGRGQQVYKFSPEGKLVMTLGTAGVAGDGPNTFNQPSHVVVAPNGDVFVTDGHVGKLGSNARVVKFSRDGRFIKSWGKMGTRPGEFSDPHAIGMDSQGRVFVADRGNSRIQIFDQDGVFLDEWRQFGGPSGMYIAPDDTLYAANAGDRSPIRGVVIGSAKTGSMMRLIEGWFPESIIVKDGVIYAGEAGSHRSKQPLKKLVMPPFTSSH